MARATSPPSLASDRVLTSSRVALPIQGSRLLWVSSRREHCSACLKLPTKRHHARFTSVWSGAKFASLCRVQVLIHCLPFGAGPRTFSRVGELTVLVSLVPVQKFLV
ncbi:unnamed protein product [Prorocentrum cordatum]|uniref:Uncharacterized protein n=1 Tax=Prorocentrum cordatum TaxID=2364126 RepID=A0ABN9S329_9DINO|nr:unnamed protein product [Polarella glacialis]